MAEAQTMMRILLIDDDAQIRRSIGDFLTTRQHQVFPARNGREGLEILQQEQIDIAITDLKMPGMDGFEVLKQVRDRSPETEVILITGYGDIDTAVQAVREGAFDFFTKPVKMRELAASLERTVRFHLLRAEKDRVQARLDRIGAEARQRYGLSALIGESSGILEVKHLVEQVAMAEDTTVFVCGETGTGKEVVARAIHYESSRREGPFVAVDCTAIPQNLIESEFYGHEKGAFTDARESHKGHFELANGGTLFLDEIGDMDPTMQSRLLRTLEERRIRRVGGSKETPVDVRVISATNQDLPEAIASGRFRQDLYHRLNTFAIQIPPLRERRADLLVLAQHFLARYAQQMRKPALVFGSEAEVRLQTHPFPGNVRELKNTVERAVILCTGDVITPDHLEFTPHIPAVSGEEKKELSTSGLKGEDGLEHLFSRLPEGMLALSEIEAAAIREALERSRGNRGQAAEMLGLSRFALRRRIAEYGIGECAE